MRPANIIFILCALLLLLSLPGFAVSASSSAKTLPIPANFTVEYVLESGLFTIGNTRRTLKVLDNGLYVFESYTWPAGMLSVFYNGDLTERSVWKYENNMAVPLEYIYKDTNKGSERDAVLTFDWEKNVVTNNINDEPWNLDIKKGTLDKLLYQLSIMIDLVNDSKRTNLKYAVADGGKLRTYIAEIKEPEIIKTPAGSFETVRIVRESRKSITTLWCAPSLKYLPVRIEHYKIKRGTRVNAYLTSVAGLP
ncbi:DUF3108 domain-containing protein [Kaarinaea lacus]